MHTVICYYRQLALRPKQVPKNCLLPETHLYVIYDSYVTFPTTPYEIIKMCPIVSFDKLYNEYLGFKYHVLNDNQLTISKLQTACFYHKYLKNYSLNI